MSTCTSLDHVYPGTSHPLTPGTPCFCGARTVGGVTRKAVKTGARVRVYGIETTTLAKIHGEDAWRVTDRIKGREIFETAELEVL